VALTGVRIQVEERSFTRLRKAPSFVRPHPLDILIECVGVLDPAGSLRSMPA